MPGIPRPDQAPTFRALVSQFLADREVMTSRGEPARPATMQFYRFALDRFLEWVDAEGVQVYEVFRVGGGALRGLWRVWCGRLAWEWGAVGPPPHVA